MFTIEYVSVISGVSGLLIFIFLFIPKNENPSIKAWLKTFYPYFFFILFLLIARYFLSDIYWNIHQHIRPVSLYQPGAVFIFTGFLYYLFIVKRHQHTLSYIRQNKNTLRIILRPVFTILILVCYTQIIRTDLALIAQAHLHDYSDTVKSVINPLLGIAGSFLSGSATMSNLAFGNAIQTNAISLDNLPLLTALLHTGSAIGNAVSLQNILMVKSVVNVPEINYSKVLKLNAIVVGAYLLIVVIHSLILHI